MNQIKKGLSIFIIFLVIGANVFAPLSILAVEETPAEQTLTPTPTPTETQTVAEETPTVTPTPTPTETVVDVSNEGTLNNDINSQSNTGENLATQSADITPTPAEENSSPESNLDGSENGSGAGSSSTIDTGDSASVTEAENKVNTNIVNSKIVNHTINLFVDENGNIDLSDPFTIAENIVVNNGDSEDVVNVLATDAANYTILSNDVVTISDTGSNSIEGAKEATIKTGNAYSITSLLNQVNFTIVGSVIHVVTINIFGNLTGDIILPEFSSLESCSTCGMSISTENEAVVNNNVDSNANSGKNVVEHTNDGEIETGNAVSVVNLTNLINTNIFGMLLFNLAINNFGNWGGQFLGWGNVFGPDDADSLALNFISSGDGSGCTSCTGDVSIYNSAQVDNNISSDANTGKNTIKGVNGKINTGNAYSAVTLTNFVNTNIINSVGFFGFINIFGKWTGNIGGKSAFITPTPTPDLEEETAVEETPENTSRESGGNLSVDQTNNVGEYVLPGDTVTFFVKTKNIGSGMVYGAKLHLHLYKDGKNQGGYDFDLKDIPAGKGSYLTTGFVLSKKSPGGLYTARALVDGTTGDDNTQISAFSDSDFFIQGGEVLAVGDTGSPDKPAKNIVLGATTLGNNYSKNGNWLMFLLAFFTGSFLVIRGIRRKDKIKALFIRSAPFYTRLQLLRSFLL